MDFVDNPPIFAFILRGKGVKPTYMFVGFYDEVGLVTLPATSAEARADGVRVISVDNLRSALRNMNEVHLYEEINARFQGVGEARRNRKTFKLVSLTPQQLRDYADQMEKAGLKTVKVFVD
ncbi:hypothetical protein A3K34_03780 [candidate division WWE3 bacterium RIFOXYC1_FULL_40_10]|nr:MAG: hypothetical protein A3K58_03780 [candidate division WWE3 bacterium RIFOXYB1_FULL_40_22]OGC61961.1 MAG: hypothetical protein A3K37_03780 [candidate division WWE3 bacterium RIFOXYA1_FULL_40_11]OGC64518.1 MAG: hypothetical protein A2326_03920 [candidate division WWE3 bacterium RIFOXYB2_FULL_41_6]OGC66344.1 MAG: hypothetical protein A3K34_03780 [candidate division WWE3 bacterium RIFOXYC1_FULL_40_10]OGC67946.1 MAG: hypothetical protein A2450_01975 [candidate division WWE3 bacterium RIFOXYC2